MTLGHSDVKVHDLENNQGLKVTQDFAWRALYSMVSQHLAVPSARCLTTPQHRLHIGVSAHTSKVPVQSPVS